MIIFDEKKHAETMLKKGFLTKHKNVYELNILARYYFYKDMSEDEVKNKIVEFCKKRLEYFDMDEWYKIINNTINSAKRKKLVTGKEVVITEGELEVIQSLDDIKEQKLAFSMLVIYKFYDCNKFKIILKDLFDISELTTCNSKTRLHLLQSLTLKKIIDIDMKGRRWVNISDTQNIEAITITNFDNLIYEYLLLIGEDGYKKCELCSIAIFHRNINAMKYCKQCAETKEKERKRRLRENESVANH